MIDAFLNDPPRQIFAVRLEGGWPFLILKGGQLTAPDIPGEDSGTHNGLNKEKSTQA